jgi:hypothetical protein
LVSAGTPDFGKPSVEHSIDTWKQMWNWTTITEKRHCWAHLSYDHN